MTRAAISSNPPPAPSADSRILELAAGHIRQFGAERTTIVSIARAARMSHANVYRYFGSKEALFDAVTGQWLQPIEAGLRDITDAADPAHDKIERMLSMVYRAYRGKLDDDPNIFRLFAAATRDNSATAKRHGARLQMELRRVVEEGMASGGFFNADPARAVTLVLDGAHRFIHPIAIDLDSAISRAQLDARFERISRLISRALVVGVR